MFSLLLQTSPNREDYLIAELWQEGTAGLVEEDGRLRAFFDDGCDVGRLLDRFAEFGPELREEPNDDWERLSREAWPPLMIGERFFLVAPWSTEETPSGRLRLEVNPGMACGTGRHPATQLCLEALEQCVRPGDHVLDVGAGSGILSAAASLLGAGLVIGCDVDHEAVKLAHERVRLPLFTGSADAVSSNWADVVIANIDSATIERIAPELERARKPNSTLIISGFPGWDLPEGFSARRLLEREEWRCMICGAVVHN